MLAKNKPEIHMVIHTTLYSMLAVVGAKNKPEVHIVIHLTLYTVLVVVGAIFRSPPFTIK